MHLFTVRFLLGLHENKVLTFWDAGWMTKEELEKVYKKKAKEEAKRRRKEKEAKKVQMQEALPANASPASASVAPVAAFGNI